MARVNKTQYKVKVFTYLALSTFISVVLFSQVNVVMANVLDRAPLAQGSLDSSAREEAQRLFNAGMKLYGQGTAESLRKSIEKLKEALELYRQIDDKEMQALTLKSIGSIYNSLGDKQQALKFFNQALKFYNQSLLVSIEVGDKAGQARILNTIAEVYDSLGDKQQALKFYNQSLSLFIEVGDKAEQAN